MFAVAITAAIALSGLSMWRAHEATRVSETMAETIAETIGSLTAEAEMPSVSSSETLTNLTTLVETDPEGAVALVRQVLTTHPEILEEAIAALDVVRAEDEAQRVASALEESAEALYRAETASVLGNPDGAITVVEFLDYNCSFCKRAHGDISRLIAENSDVRVLVRDFPVLGPGSLEAAQVASAFRTIGGDMGLFLDRMMAEELEPAGAALATSVALQLGADEEALNNAMTAASIMEPIGETYALADALGIRGTPAFVIGGELIVGAVGFDRLSEAVQAERDRLNPL